MQERHDQRFKTKQQQQISRFLFKGIHIKGIFIRMEMNKAEMKLKSIIKYYSWKDLREHLVKIPLYR